MIGALTFFILACCLIVPANISWTRNVINFLVYQLALIYMHFMGETAERRVYTLRDQLKTQFKATRKAQVNERKASDSKRRLTSYVFHDKLLT
jgi:osomolarity two-component system sensor histidine kinase SLN1